MTNVFYLIYLYDEGNFSNIYVYIKISILVGLLQFIIGLINPNMSYFLGPTYISKLIYGQYATPTFTNFYALLILGMNRASGLSREVGFFLTLLIIAYIIYLEHPQKKHKMKKIFYLGFIIWISKMIFLLPIYIIVKKYRKYLYKINSGITFIALTIIFIIISNIIYSINFFVKANETWVHRLGGYYLFGRLNLFDTVFSSGNMKTILKNYNFEYVKDFVQLNEFTGIANLLIHHRFLEYLLFLFLIIQLKPKTSKIIILIFISMTTSFFTLDSFIILSYFYCFYKFKVETIKRNDIDVLLREPKNYEITINNRSQRI